MSQCPASGAPSASEPLLGTGPHRTAPHRAAARPGRSAPAATSRRPVRVVPVIPSPVASCTRRNRPSGSSAGYRSARRLDQFSTAISLKRPKSLAFSVTSTRSLTCAMAAI